MAYRRALARLLIDAAIELSKQQETRRTMMGSSRCCGALSSLSSSSSISALMAPTTLAPSRHLSVLPAPRMPVASRLVSQRRQFHRSGPCAAGGKWSAREDSKLFFPLTPKQIRWANSTEKKNLVQKQKSQSSPRCSTSAPRARPRPLRKKESAPNAANGERWKL